MDVVYLIGTAVFFGLLVLLAVGCEKLGGVK